MEDCKLCRFTGCRPAGVAAGRPLLDCPRCGLVFVPESHWLSQEDERARYALHDNRPANEGYVRFLGEVAAVVLERAGAGAGACSRVLDFGSGPAAVLGEILRGAGLEYAAYDPLYGVGPDALKDGAQYDAVVMCEVIEHLRDLRVELQGVGRVVRAGGRVVVRTQLRPAVEEIPRWWYARDPTHVNFLAQATLDWVAAEMGCAVEARGRDDVFVFRKAN